MHHFVSLPTDLKIRKNESYLRTPHEHRNSLPLPKMLFSEFVSSKTTVRTRTSLDFCYCKHPVELQFRHYSEESAWLTK